MWVIVVYIEGGVLDGEVFVVGSYETSEAADADLERFGKYGTAIATGVCRPHILEEMLED